MVRSWHEVDDDECNSMYRICDITHMRYRLSISHMRYIAHAIWIGYIAYALYRICVIWKFKYLAGLRFGISFGSNFRIPNLLARKNQPGLLLKSFRTLSICSDYIPCFDMTYTIFFYENVRYCRVRNDDSEYIIFSFKTMFYLFIIIFLIDTR